MTDADLITSGVVLLTVVAVAFGGGFMLSVVRGAAPANELQRTYFRAGHAHAGVLVILGLVIKLLLAGIHTTPLLGTLSNGALWAAILMPAGFFLSVVGVDPDKPNALRVLIPLGALVLVVGVVAAGVALISAGAG
jgi:hypothetical protein